MVLVASTLKAGSDNIILVFQHIQPSILQPASTHSGHLVAVRKPFILGVFWYSLHSSTPWDPDGEDQLASLHVEVRPVRMCVLQLRQASLEGRGAEPEIGGEVTSMPVWREVTSPGAFGGDTPAAGLEPKKWNGVGSRSWVNRWCLEENIEVYRSQLLQVDR